MLSKERVRKVLEGEIPDKVPLGEFAVDSDTVERILGHETYFRAKAKCMIAFWDGRRQEVVDSWKEDCIALFKKLDIMDIIHIAHIYAPPKGYKPEAPKKIDETTWEYKDGRILKYSELTKDLSIVHDPNQWTREISENFDLDPEVPPVDPSVFEAVDPVIKEFGDSKYILGNTGGGIELPFLGGSERGYVELIERPELIKKTLQAWTNAASKRDRYYQNSKIDGTVWGQDNSSNLGPMISSDIFRNLALPFIKMRVKKLHNEGLKIIKHACGNNWLLMDLFLEAGYDAYQGIQISAGMEMKRLKEEYGKKITLWGGCKVENLVRGSKEDIINDVEYSMKHCKPGGRYIFGSTHSIAVGTNYDNFMTMLETAEKLQKY